MKWLLVLVVLGFAATACTTQQQHRGGMDGMQNMSKDGSMMGGKGMMNGKGMMMKGMMSPEMHKNMAKMHTEMAQCLKTKKSKKECRKVMKKHQKKMCPQMAKNKSCPMMSMMMGETQESTKKEDNHEEHH